MSAAAKSASAMTVEALALPPKGRLIGVDLGTKTITVPMSGSTEFYRIRSMTALTITSITLSGGNVVIAYH